LANNTAPPAFTSNAGHAAFSKPKTTSGFIGQSVADRLQSFRENSRNDNEG
jgi:hypothetical protein